MDLFSAAADDINKPLAEKMRPQTLKDFVGQENIFNQLRKMIESGNFQSMIFFWFARYR